MNEIAELESKKADANTEIANINNTIANLSSQNVKSLT